MTVSPGPQRHHGRDLQLTNLDRVLFPDRGITKGDLVGYSTRIATTMAPYVVGRPVALTRFPGGLDDAGFFQKNVSGHFPDWIGRVEIPKRDGGTTDNLVLSGLRP